MHSQRRRREELADAPPQRPLPLHLNHASWLNQVEVWFNILSRQTLKRSNVRFPREVRDRIDALIQYYNRDARPFNWHASSARPSTPRAKIADLPE